MSTCIFPGRFQPFHTGHLMVVQGMIKSCGKVVIAICYGDAREDDLFSAEEVREMISAALLAEDIVDANIVDVSDCEDDAEWVDKILEAAGNPEEVKMWTGDDDMKQIFETAGLAIQNISPVPGFNGTEIRKMIESKDSTWREKVPAGALDVVYGKFFKE
ncbi:hypothetical protein CO057_01930 [Candidatus Uhrbacteria bacterium CG_4_9_14_0_2_um_filter_41_50]|uniref:Cytidyltransferase-like domain-containing protein n=1 Tax=Candidatus Uhrbacteria bacterium CG_4_9_14_0_2_um_filter_41_50 TaxID=1975031 RepID=A0A2M8EPK5_9BACT|nr:MAG: hypothetical protein COZ45_04505 [Candidatus Uhrbacteria bacterium CG_4_10_14_3_um_filter_41_21]PIZ54362.1 MAG: hypothetical protein COY24_04040 [Candidatus Uhrbacteria bacterium CG_4_10_14_0_2_um_filter_41_21]PJB84948.1 MAG: hypothetical protein CO086_00900 [Candidatus Uhrbacteria bacterium CG_4_9_14_0_8_um_filter_41_16]PJC24607.1 MAG: hypothetical protein CO057_01930 [Candidatus Uhrbacteria bacterium CG_4_9_14_0_2_um_filter_41_50]PJE74775.1 MAG: hypothetical protein COV03_03735 [Candi